MNTGRRPRRSREELRALLLAAGRSILLEEGLGPGADALNFKRAFDLVEAETGFKLTNASVIGRVWGNLADYQTDVLVELASDTSRSNVPEVAELVAGVLAGCDLSSASGARRPLPRSVESSGRPSAPRSVTRRAGRSGSTFGQPQSPATCPTGTRGCWRSSWRATTPSTRKEKKPSAV